MVEEGWKGGGAGSSFLRERLAKSFSAFVKIERRVLCAGVGMVRMSEVVRMSVVSCWVRLVVLLLGGVVVVAVVLGFEGEGLDVVLGVMWRREA